MTGMLARNCGRGCESMPHFFVKQDGKDKPYPNIPCASLNFDVLKPLVERLEESPGNLGMHSIPELTKQKPGQVISSFPFDPLICICSIISYQFWTVLPTNFHQGLLTKWSLTNSRIKAFYQHSRIPVPVKKDLKSTAKLAKSFMVLLKNKLQRGQVCRCYLFRRLMALAYAATRSKAKD